MTAVGKIRGRTTARAAWLGLLAAVALLALLGLPATASAGPGGATIVVTTTADDNTAQAGQCTLRDAITAANTDQTVSGSSCAAGVSGTTSTIELQQPGGYSIGFGLEDFTPSSDMTIVGQGAFNTFITACDGGNRVMEVAGGNVTLDGVEIACGTSFVGDPDNHPGFGGGIYVDSGASLTLKDSWVEGEVADISGGGIYNAGSLTVIGSTFENNDGDQAGGGGGGAIAGFGSSLSITNSTLYNNTGEGGGGGLYLGEAATLLNDTIAKNASFTSGGGGAGIAVNGIDPHTVVLTNTLLAGNREAGGILSECSASLASNGGNLDDDGSCGLGAGDLSNDQNVGVLSITNNQGPTPVAPLQSGSDAIDAGNTMDCPRTDQLLVARPQGSGCDIGAYEYTAPSTPPADYYVSTVAELDAATAEAENNEVPATIHIAAGHYDIGNLDGTVQTGAGLTFAGAGAATTILDGDGVADHLFGIGGSALTTIKGLTVENSDKVGISSNGDLELDNSIVQGNPLGISSSGSGLDVSGSTISGNGTSGGGLDNQANGGIYSSFPQSATLSNTTISGNYGFGLYPAGNATVPPLHLKNVTIANNPGDGIAIHAPIDAVDTIVADNGDHDCINATENMSTLGHNLDSDGTCTFTNPSDLPDTNPTLGPLQDNGGPTPTMALLAGSPAIDAGDDSSCTAVDQRGVPRPRGAHCDIGAFEFDPPLVVNTAADTDDGSCTATLCSLRDAIEAANGAPFSTITFDIPGGGLQTISLAQALGNLPLITAPVTIDGTTEPGVPPGKPGVTIAVNPVSGFAGPQLEPGSDGSTIRGLAIGGANDEAFKHGAIDVASNGDTIEDDYIGVSADGSSGNNNALGIVVTGNDATIGGDSSAGDGNVIVGSTTGIVVEAGAEGTVIQGNQFGIYPNGTEPPGSGIATSIDLEGATGTVIGNNDGPDGLGDVQGHPELGNVIADSSDAVRVAASSSGSIVAGNFLGVDRTDNPTSANDVGIDVSAASGNQIGPGNVIADSGTDGVLINATAGPASGDRIVANSIYGSSSGIELRSGANDGIAAPTVSSVVGTSASGTVTGNPGDAMFVELYGNPSCDNTTNGAGRDYLGFAQATIGGSGTATWNTSISPGNDEGVTATVTNQLDDTSQFSTCTTVGGSGGTLSGQLSTSGQQNADLSSLGTEDWAVWGYANSGTSTSLAPDVRKAGGSGISDLSDLDPTNAPLRGLGQFAGAGDEPFGFDWSDGTVPASATGAAAGLEHDGQPGLVGTNGDGFSFTVPADTTQRTLTIYTSAHWATGTLTATLSDGSAPPYTQTVTSSAGDNAGTGDNDPGVFTIDYAAASAGQHLTVNWVETAGTCPSFGCDDAAIYAVALSGAASTATGASATFGASGPVAISGTVPISNIPLAAFDPQPPGAPPITIQNAQLGHTQLGQTQLGHTQLGQTQLGQTQLGHTQLGQTQLGQTQLGHTQLGHTQLGQTQLGQTQLGQTQLGHTQLGQTQLGHTQLAQTGLTLNLVPLDDPTEYPNGWTDVLQGTSLAGEPLQTITLDDVYSLTGPPDALARIQNLTFADVDLPDSTLGQITMDALTLGPSLINQLGGTLQSDIESQLHDWCVSVESSGDTSFCDGSDPGIGYFSLMQLGLIGAPVDTLQLGQTQLGQTQLGHTQLGQTQLGQTPLDDLSGSASGIVGMQLGQTDLTTPGGIGDLLVGSLPNVNTLFDCTNPGTFDCSTGTLAEAQAAGAIKPGTLVGDLDQGNFFQGVTIEELLNTIRGPNSAYANLVTFGDVVGLLIRSTDVSWESLSPDLLTIFDPNRSQLPMTAGFTIAGTGSPSADVRVDLPPGFDYKPGSATLTKGSSVASLADPTIVSTSADSYALDWHLDSVDAGQPYSIDYDALAGTTVGPTQATETVSAGGKSSSSVASFSVTDSFPDADSAPDATSIDTTPGHETVEMSALPTAGAVDYYKIDMPPAGTRISVHLTDLPADYDLALYSPQSTSVRTTTPGLDPSAPPLQGGVVPDTQVNLDGGSSGQLTPTGLEDVPDPGIPLVQLSDNRHEDDEDVGMVSPGGGGQVTIAVFGYNGASSPDAYTLRVRESAPPTTQICPARVLPDAGQGSTTDSLPVLSSLPSNLNTIILVNERRLGDTYGGTDESNAVAKLHSLAGDGPLGVSGTVVPVETIPGVQSLYDTWDSNPCDPSSANAIANAIANEVDAIVAARPTVKYVVFAGGDDQIPFFRLPDLSLIANESGFTGLGANEYGGSLAAGDLLSDDPYLDTQPVPAGGQQLFPPNLSGGRLVETAQDIANAVTSFQSSSGALKSSTGFVSGYDFVADGAQSVASNLTANGVNVRGTLIDPLGAAASTLFGKNDLLDAAFPPDGTGTPADINSWNGHYDNYRAQMANGDIISTSDLPTAHPPTGGIFFTMGCHAGFQTTDAVVGSSVLDWPQYFAQHDTGFVGNTGFGLGETDSVAFSEELMADFAGQLTPTATLGNALMQAKQQYYLSRVAFSNYDEKALSEAELYGLPMYGIGHSPTGLASPSDPPPDPVNGSSASTSPSTGSLSSFPGSGVQSAGFAVTPSFSAEQHGANGDFFTNAGQVQAPNYRPLQPYVSLPAGRSDSPGLYAHGVVVDSLTSQDNSPFTPDNVRPTLNASADEPPPSFTEESWPEKIPTLVSLGQNQNLNLATGQFFTPTGGGAGVERLWTQIGGRVTYSTSQDFTPPTIDSIDAFESDPGQSDDVLGFSGRFSDLDQNGNPGTVVFAQVVYDADNAGHWQAVQLQQDGTSNLWSAGVPFSGTHVQYFVEACDAAGNCGYSSNKGDYFDAQALPPGTATGSGGSAGTLTISPSRQPDAGSWYDGGLTVSAGTSAPDATVSVTVDGVVQPPGPVSLTGDGAHVVIARDSAGNVATGIYLIDTTGPTITHTVSPAAPDGNNGWYKTAPTVTFDCADNLSGVASCLAAGGQGNSKKLPDSASSQTVDVAAADNAGNTSTGSATVTKVDSTPPTTPSVSGIQAISYKPSAVPAQSAISCSSTDALSGLAGCVVTGYSAALGQHILTATATDKAGNTSVTTLTYTVAKLNPNITWNPPSTMLFGTPLSSTQLNATADVPGSFAYAPPAGTVLQPGPQVLQLTFTPNNTTDYNAIQASRPITVAFSQACQTGTVSGSLTIKSGNAYCLQGGKVTGSITVQSGGSLYITGATVSGSVTATGATAVTLCGTKVSGSTTIGTSTGPVELGGPSGNGCAGNTLAAVTLTGNKGAVIADGNTIGGSVTASSNSGGFVFSANQVTGAVTVSGNSGGVTVTNNTVKGSATITNNTGGFTYSGNTVSGTVTLKNNS